MFLAHLRGSRFRPYGPDLGVRIESADVATYADVSVVCEPVQRDEESGSCVTNPRVVVEVLSPHTERYDREQKRLYYQQLPSLVDYVLIAQDRRHVEVWHREGDEWSRTVYEAGAKAPLHAIDYELDVDELYDLAGVDVR